MNAQQKEIIRSLDAFAYSTSDGEIAGLRVATIESILRSGGLTLVEGLTQNEWQDFCSKIISPFDNKNSEGAGIHPTVQEIFAQCHSLSGNRFRIIHEMNLNDLGGIVKRPDLSILSNIPSPISESIEHVIVPCEIKKFGDLKYAIHQALRYLVSKIRNLLDLYGFGSILSGFCVGTDGLNLAVGYVQIKDDVLTVLSTGADHHQLWPEIVQYDNPATYPENETRGVRILRTLLSSTMGHSAFAPPSCDAGGWNFAPISVIGRGAFCTAIIAQARKGASVTAVGVVLKREGFASIKKHPDILEQLSRECEILRQFTATCGSPHLPVLLDVNWQVTQEAPFVPLLPVCQPLEVRCAMLSANQRLSEASKIVKQATLGLQAAHDLNLCHRDVRPQNIVYNEVKRVYTVVDWGLAAAPGVLMHKHRGGMPYWHDDLINARHSEIDINYIAEYDISAMTYVAYAFTKGAKLTVSWHDKAEDLIADRAEEVAEFMQSLNV